MKQKYQCQALDGHGRRCKSEAMRVVEYFGDENIPSQEHLSWVCVQLCADHSNGLSEFPDEDKHSLQSKMNPEKKGGTA